MRLLPVCFHTVERRAMWFLAGVAVISLLPRLSTAQDTVSAPVHSTTEWTAGVAAFTGMRGAASITIAPYSPTNFRATIHMRSVPMNRRVSWDIVAGTCGDEGRPIAAAAIFRFIISRNDGSAELQAMVPPLESGKRYYVRLFPPNQVPHDWSGYACANLTEAEPG